MQASTEGKLSIPRVNCMQCKSCARSQRGPRHGSQTRTERPTVVHVLLELSDAGGDAGLAVDALDVQALELDGGDEPLHHHGDAHIVAHQSVQRNAKHLAALQQPSRGGEEAEVEEVDNEGERSRILPL